MTDIERKKRGRKGGGTVYQRPDGLWVVEVTRDGVRHRKTGKTEAAAKLKLAIALGEKVCDPNNPTVAEHLMKWVNGHTGLKDETIHKYRQIIEGRLIPAVGPIYLKELSPSNVRQMVNALADEGLKPGTLRNIRCPLSAACQQAVEDGIIPENPAAITIKGKSGNRASTVKVSVAQARRLLDACRDSYLFPVWAICLYAGLRVGEALALTWADIDFDERQISVRQNLTRVKAKSGMVRDFGTPKTEDSVRSVPIAEELLEILQQHRDRSTGPVKPAGLLFPGKRKPKLPTSQTTALRNLYRALENAGMGLVRQHDLRHWCATLLIGSGVPVPTVAKILGHANPAITFKLYAHVLSETERRATDVIRFRQPSSAA